MCQANTVTVHEGMASRFMTPSPGTVVSKDEHVPSDGPLESIVSRKY